MTLKRMRNRATVAKWTCAVIGAGAVAVLGAMSAALPGPSQSPTNLRASSGDAPYNTTYWPPSVSTMNTGATATFATPGSELGTYSASPTAKATPYGGG
jgi:hypothetical protein